MKVGGLLSWKRRKKRMGILTEALIDTGKLVPLLALTYFFIGFLEHRYGDRINHHIIRIGALGPVAGALFGCIPQCGFSVVASALYVKRLISVGTLLSVFLSTSDEAVPILISMPDKVNIAGLLIAIKIIVAVVAGTIVDYVIRTLRLPAPDKGQPAEESYCKAVDGHPGCCAHELDSSRSRLKALALHPLLHTLKIVSFLLFSTIVFSYLVAYIGETRIDSILLKGTLFQPVLTSLLGLIPNCFSSVLLVQLFDKGAIDFGSMAAGLSAASGLGLLVLFKENKDLKDTLRVIGLLLFISVITGIALQLTHSVKF